jgi:hypothetical protein
VVIKKSSEAGSSSGSEESSFGTPVSQDMSLGAEELSQAFGISSCIIMARMELGGAKKTSCVI